MGDWRTDALDEITGLKPYWVRKYRWAPDVVEGVEAIDLFVSVRGRRLGDQTFLLRLRYQSDWQVAGRREAFVNPENPTEAGPEFWPTAEIRGLIPRHQPNASGPVIPCICLRGVWGYHSVLHTGESVDPTRLLTFLLELQEVIDE